MTDIQYVAASSDMPHGDPSGWYADTLWPWLIDQFVVKSMFDVGCGQGLHAEWFAGAGVDAWGCDMIQNSWNRFQQWNARHGSLFPGDSSHLPADRVDLVWSCEFVEHVEEAFAINIADTFRAFTGRVLAMTHATVGQGGVHHVNCQMDRYWIEQIESVGLRFDWEATESSRRIGHHGYWARTGMLFLTE